jgi:hypothetical protein
MQDAYHDWGDFCVGPTVCSPEIIHGLLYSEPALGYATKLRQDRGTVTCSLACDQVGRFWAKLEFLGTLCDG